MDISYLLLISPLKVLHCHHRVLNSHSLGMSLDLTNAFIHCTMCLYIIGLMSRVFANGLGDWDSISGRVIPKNKKIVFDATLLNTQHYKVGARVKWSNSGKGIAPSSTPWYRSYRAFGSPLTKVANFTYCYIHNVSADTSFSLFQVFHVKLSNLQI